MLRFNSHCETPRIHLRQRSQPLVAEERFAIRQALDQLSVLKVQGIDLWNGTIFVKQLRAWNVNACL